MTLEQIILCKNLLKLLIPFLLILLVMKFDFKDRMADLGTRSRDYAEKILKRSKIRYLEPDSIQKYLESTGAVYMFQDAANPAAFILLKILSAVLFYFAAVQVGGKIILVLAFCVGGFFLPEILLSASDYFDNEAILPDMKKIYDTLRIQTRAGVFLDDALSECYLAVKNRRLKSALLELTNEISIKKNIEDALENFNRKFRNDHIKTFCMVIAQAQDSGKSEQLLKDLSSQMKDLQHAINLKNREALERKVQIVELLIFVGLLAVTVYCLGLEVTTSLGIS
jgi:pilus assembly protein TadC